MKTPTQRGPYGRWLQAVRLERGLSTAEAARQALEAAGIFIAKSTYAEYESGAKVPSRNHLPELERFFGPFSDPDSGKHTPESGSMSELIAEMRERNKLDRELIAEQRAMVAAQAALAAAIEQAAASVMQGQQQVQDAMQARPQFDPTLYRFVQESDGTLSLHPRDDVPGTPARSEPRPAGPPSRRPDAVV